MSPLRARLAESLRACRRVLGNRELRRLQLALGGSVIGQWAFVVVLSVFAYRHGGAAAVGIVGLIQLLPAAIASPFAAVLGDRYPRRRVLVVTELARTGGLAAAAAAAYSGAPAWVVFAFGGLVAVVGTAFRPAAAALLPSLARDPEELAAANLVSVVIESAGYLVGPALAGLLLAATSAGTVFAATGLAFLSSGLLAGFIRAGSTPAREQVEAGGGALLAGFRAIASESKLRLLVGLYSAQTLVAGAFRVLLVVTALRVLDLGPAGVGFLSSAVGIGGLVGMLVALAFVAQRRLAAEFALGVLLWGIPLILVGLWPRTAPALVFLGLLGLGDVLVDTAGTTLLQRAVPDEVLSRVFGVLQSVLLGTIGIGSILAPALIAALGPRGALVATGAFLPVVTLLAWRSLRELDHAALAAPADVLVLLRGIPIFAPLPAASLERLAARAIPVDLPAGATVFRRGDPGTRFYVVADGEVEIAPGDRNPLLAGPGQYFGELALLHDLPRTASVHTLSETRLYALERGDFLVAVTAHAQSTTAAATIVASRLGSSHSEPASL